MNYRGSELGELCIMKSPRCPSEHLTNLDGHSYCSERPIRRLWKNERTECSVFDIVRSVPEFHELPWMAASRRAAYGHFHRVWFTWILGVRALDIQLWTVAQVGRTLLARRLLQHTCSAANAQILAGWLQQGWRISGHLVAAVACQWYRLHV